MARVRGDVALAAEILKSVSLDVRKYRRGTERAHRTSVARKWRQNNFIASGNPTDRNSKLMHLVPEATQRHGAKLGDFRPRPRLRLLRTAAKPLPGNRFANRRQSQRTAPEIHFCGIASNST